MSSPFFTRFKRFNSSDNVSKSPPVAMFIGCFVSLWTFIFLYSFVISQYFQYDSLAGLWSFGAADPPGNIQSECVIKPLGMHYFGDFGSIYCHSQLGSPYLSQVDTNYFPFSYVVLRPVIELAGNNYLGALAIFLIIGAILVLFPFWKVLRRTGNSRADSAIFLVTVILSAGFLSQLDRGNIQLLVTGCLVFGFYCLSIGKDSNAGVLIGLSAALKGYPAVFLFVLLRERRWRTLFVATMTAVLTTVTSLVLFEGTARSNLGQMSHDILGFNQAGDLVTRYNISIRALLISLIELKVPAIDSSAKYLLANYEFVVIAFLLICILLIFDMNLGRFEVCLVGGVLCSGLIGQSSTYVLGAFFPSLLFLLLGDYRLWGRPLNLLVIFTSILLIPKSIPIGSPWSSFETIWTVESPSLTSLINPLAMIGIISVLLCNSLLSRARVRNFASEESLSAQ